MSKISDKMFKNRPESGQKSSKIKIAQKDPKCIKITIGIMNMKYKFTLFGTN